MKNFASIFLITTIMNLFLACNNQHFDKSNFEFSADSTFLKTLDTKNIKPIKAINNFEIGNDRIYSLIKPKMKFYQIKEFNIAKNIRAVIFFTQQPLEMTLDGELKILYFATFDNNNNIISNLRIAKIEQLSDSDNLETAKIVGTKIIKQTKSISINEDGSLNKTQSIEKFEIKDSGKIIAVD